MLLVIYGNYWFTLPGGGAVLLVQTFCLRLSKRGRRGWKEGPGVVPPTYISGVTHAHPLCLVVLACGGNLHCEGGLPGWC
jgi:hypothetical protein